MHLDYLINMTSLGWLCIPSLGVHLVAVMFEPTGPV